VTTVGSGRAKESNNRIILALVMMLLVIGVAGVVYPGPTKATTSTTSTTSTSSTLIGGVTVFGLVSTTGAGTHPVSMNFVSLRTSTAFAAPASSGRFSILLPNHDAYSVTMEWEGNYTGQRGQAAAGTVSLNFSAGSNMAQSDNLNLPTPNSVVNVNGTIPWQVVTSQPVSVRFTASYGENFTAPVSPEYAFSIQLPNMMDYQVEIQAQNSTGYQEWYYAHTLQVAAGVNVLGLLVRISY
jgi:hypothetical protein